VAKPDLMRERIAAFSWPRCGVVVMKASRGYTLYSARTGEPIARFRPTGDGDRVQVLWRRRGMWGASGPFGIATMPLDRALDYVASDPTFWINP
jgi:hypothetical protein